MKKLLYSNDNIKSFTKTTAKPKVVENIVVRASPEYQEKYGPVETLLGSMKTTAKKPIIIDLESTSEDAKIAENPDHSSSQTMKKGTNK